MPYQRQFLFTLSFAPEWHLSIHVYGKMPLRGKINRHCPGYKSRIFRMLCFHQRHARLKSRLWPVIDHQLLKFLRIIPIILKIHGIPKLNPFWTFDFKFFLIIYNSSYFPFSTFTMSPFFIQKEKLAKALLFLMSVL